MSKKSIKYKDILNISFVYQNTFLSLIRTVSIFIGISILIKSKWLLLFIILLFTYSLYTHYHTYQHLKHLGNHLDDYKQGIDLSLGIMNKSIYSISFILIIILIFVFLKKDI